MRAKAATAAAYLAELPPDRRAALKAVRELVLPINNAEHAGTHAAARH